MTGRVGLEREGPLVKASLVTRSGVTGKIGLEREGPLVKASLVTRGVAG